MDSRGRGGIGRGRGIPSYDDDDGPAVMYDDDDLPDVVSTRGRGRGLLGRPAAAEPVPPFFQPPHVAAAAEGVQEVRKEDEEVLEEALQELQIQEEGAAALPLPQVVQQQQRSVPTTQSPASTTHESKSSVAAAAVSITTMAPSVAGASQWSADGAGRPIPPVRVTPSTSKPERIKVVKCGVKGESTPLATNFVRLNYVNKGRIFEYHVEFDPPLDSTRMKKIAMRDLMKDKAYSFDGTMLFLTEKGDGDFIKYETQHPNVEGPMIITAAFVKEKAPNDLIQFFNILFKQMMRVLGRVQLRQNYYDVKNVKTLSQHKMEIWPGYCIAVEEQEGGLMICLDVSHRVLRQDTVFEQFTMMKGLAPDWKDKFAEFIVGKIVLTRYNNCTYKIDDIWWDSNPTATFIKRDNQITYVKYYEEQHGVQVRDLVQPLLVSRIKPRRGDLNQEEKIVALVPELCYITGLTDDQRSNFTVMKDLGEHTRLTPAQRKNSLQRFIQEVNGTPEAQQILKQWNMELEGGPVQMDGRIHTGPKLSFGKREVQQAHADFSKEALSGVIDPVKVEKYLLICTQRDMDKGRKFAETYRKVCLQLGIPTGGTPTILPIKGYQVNDFRRAIKDNVTKEYQFLFCLMPQQRDDVYSLIKKLCISELEIPSQCCLTKTLNNEKKFNSVVQRIALQINCKLGGALWALKIPFDTKIMFVGIDVAHDPKKKFPSVLGLVATLNNDCTKYASFCRILKVHQETADSLRSTFEEALETYSEFQGGYPDRIVIWRDGGMADPSTFNQHEVEQVYKAINAKCDADAKFSFVVVQKRIPQRFFRTDRTGRNWENPLPGTVIDHTVTKYDAYDFYVVSQLVRQGTVTPTHYTVIADVGDTKPDLLQKFAYVCSFMYYNWPGTVRVPAMTQYAHKLAGLVANNVRASPGKTLRDTLYYL